MTTGQVQIHRHMYNYVRATCPKPHWLYSLGVRYWVCIIGPFTYPKPHWPLPVQNFDFSSRNDRRSSRCDRRPATIDHHVPSLSPSPGGSGPGPGGPHCELSVPSPTSGTTSTSTREHVMGRQGYSTDDDVILCQYKDM